MDDRRAELLGRVRGEPLADGLDVRNLTRLVDLPELREATYLALVVGARPGEHSEHGRRHVRGVDLDQRVDELLAEAPRLGAVGQ